MKKLFLSVAALFAVCIVSAQEGVVASYNKGAEMLQSKNYPEAAKLFQKVIDEGMASEDATELNCVETAKKYLVLRDELRVLELSGDGTPCGRAGQLRRGDRQSVESGRGRRTLRQCGCAEKSQYDSGESLSGSGRYGIQQQGLRRCCRDFRQGLCRRSEEYADGLVAGTREWRSWRRSPGCRARSSRPMPPRRTAC